ncbi:COG4223 family protein [Roseivivax sp.]
MANSKKPRGRASKSVQSAEDTLAAGTSERADSLPDSAGAEDTLNAETPETTGAEKTSETGSESAPKPEEAAAGPWGGDAEGAAKDAAKSGSGEDTTGEDAKTETAEATQDDGKSDDSASEASDTTPLDSQDDQPEPGEERPRVAEAAAFGAVPSEGPGKQESTGSAPAAKETVVERRGGFLPLALGGIVAAAAGFGVSEYLNRQGAEEAASFAEETRGALEAQSGEIADLTGRLEGIETDVTAVDLSSVESAVADLTSRSAAIGEELTALSDRVAALEESGSTLTDRVSTLERAPVEDAVSPAAIEAYEQEIARLREEVQAQLAEVQAQRESVEALAEEAVAAERAAQTEARTADLRAQVAALRSALDSGQPFAQSLEPLRGSEMVELPEALTATAGDGVASMAELTESYPEAARAALAAAREAGAASENRGRIAGFFAEQLGARSVTPREGDSADAVLSRAEAALRGGDLAATLQELSALPEPAAAAMSDWRARAEARLAALEAAAALSSELDSE